MKDMKERAVKAAKRYLELRGFEILGESWAQDGLAGSIDLVARDCGEIVFATVTPGGFEDGIGFREEALSHEQFELLAAAWLSEHIGDLGDDVPVRFDRISILVISENRAMLRHCENALIGPFACM